MYIIGWFGGVSVLYLKKSSIFFQNFSPPNRSCSCNYTRTGDFNMSWIFQIGKGLLRTVLGVTSSIADVIPVDFPSNLMIVCAWYTAVHKPKPNVQVYNITTGVQNPVTWKELVGQCHCRQAALVVGSCGSVPL